MIVCINHDSIPLEMISILPAVLPQVIYCGSEDYDYSWKIFGDDALGGKSEAQVIQKEQTIEVHGNIVNINNTGFICLRSELQKHDLSNVKFINLEIKTDGRPYAFELEYNRGWHEEKLGYMLYNLPNEWTTVSIPITDFEKIKFRKVVDTNYDPKVLKKIYRFGFYVSDSIEGPFQFEIKSISFIY